MDKKLELQFIQNGYNTNNISEMDNKELERIIQSDIFQGYDVISTRGQEPGIILLNGNVKLKIKIDYDDEIVEKESSGSSLIVKNSTNKSGGLSLEFPKENQYITIEKRDGDDIALSKTRQRPQKTIDVVITNSELGYQIDLNFIKLNGTKTLYIPKSNAFEQDRLFWKHISEEIGVEFQQIGSQYRDKTPITPWYTFYDRKKSMRVTLGTMLTEHSIKADFSKTVDGEGLKTIVDGLAVYPYATDGRCNPKLLNPGKSFDTRIKIGDGEEVIEYLKNLLEYDYKK